MKKILLMIFISIFVCVGVSIADQTVTFGWEYDGATTPDGFRLFQRNQDGVYDYSAPVYDGQLMTTSLTLPNGDYAFMCRAYIGTQESSDSNEVLFTVSDAPAPITVPSRPNQLIINFE